MTREELEECLKSIKWKILKSHNGLNDYIINHNNKRTLFVVCRNKLEIRNEIFGDSFCGTFNIDFRDISVEIMNADGEIYVSITLSKNNFISFYNHNQ